MLSENLKKARRAKGLSQEELAVKLNVVRQTISKWEQGLSVPDSEMLLKVAEELDITVNMLLGEGAICEENSELKMIAAKLEVLNEQFAKQNERRRKVWRTVFVIAGALAILSLLQTLIGFIYLQASQSDLNASMSIIGGADGPTSILVSSISVKYSAIVTAVTAGLTAVVGIYKTRGK